MATKHSDLEVATIPQTYPMPYPVDSSTAYERGFAGTYEKLNASVSDAEMDRIQALPARRPRRRPWVWVGAMIVVALCMLGAGIGIGYSVGRNNSHSEDDVSPSNTPTPTADSNSATSTTTSSSSSTSSASLPTATIALKCTNNAKYTSADFGFIEECGVDYAGKGPTYNNTGTVNDVGTFAVDSFEACMDECVKQNQDTAGTCAAVTFNAVEPSQAAFGNCWTKSARGQGSSEGIDVGITASAYLDK